MSEYVLHLWGPTSEYLISAVEESSFLDPYGLMYWPFSLLYVAVGAILLSIYRGKPLKSFFAPLRTVFPRSIYRHP
jgi:hypothetical protein